MAYRCKKSPSARGAGNSGCGCRITFHNCMMKPSGSTPTGKHAKACLLAFNKCRGATGGKTRKRTRKVRRTRKGGKR